MIAHEFPRRTADLYLMIITIIIVTLLALIVTHAAVAAAAMDVFLVLIALAAAHVLRRKYAENYRKFWVFGRIPIELATYPFPIVIGGVGFFKSLFDHGYDRSTLRTLLVTYCLSAFVILHPLPSPPNKPLISLKAASTL
jgi:nicotinamide riboside transporter PnuC